MRGVCKRVLLWFVFGLFACSLTAVSSVTSYAAGETITGFSNVSGAIDETLALPDVVVVGNPADTVNVNLDVDAGTIYMPVTTGLTFSSSAPGRSVKFSGTVTNANNALAAMQFRNGEVQTANFSISLIEDGEVFFPDNGHLYEVVNDPGITADEALVAASARTKYGAQGYLATVTTQAEDDYIGARLNNDGWMGASDSETEGVWKWITGPEAGTTFWNGDGDGSVASGQYANWGGGEPNDSYAEVGEDCAQFLTGGGWNDLNCSEWPLNYYVVEYGAPGDLPSVESETFTITTSVPDGEPVPISSCLDLIAVEEADTVHRFDDLYLTSDIDCTGESLLPLFDDTLDAGEYPLAFRGTFDGNGHTITGIDVTGFETASNIGLFARANGATFQDLTINGTSVATDASGSCIGGLVGNATNVSVTNVSLDVEVVGGSSVGGLIGCAYYTSGTHELSDNTVSDAAYGIHENGGLVGFLGTSGESVELSILGNTISAIVSNDTWTDGGYVSKVGGIAGIFEMYNGAATHVAGNTVPGITNQNAYEVGGLFGDFEGDEETELVIGSNTLSGELRVDGTVGGFIGEGYVEDGASLTITDVTLGQNITSGDSYAGGLIGEFYLEGDETTALNISETSVSGNIVANGDAGGLIGEVYADYGDETFVLSEVSTSGSVTSSDSAAGGLVGDAASVSIEKSSASGNISAYENSGGLVGYSYESSITESYASGDVSAEYSGAGGLIGRATSDTYIAESFATGDASAETRAGGLAGAIGSGSEVINSYSRGSATADDNVGGFVGRCGGSISNSYATGEVTTAEEDGPMGFLGNDQGCDVENSFWDMQTSGANTSDAATGKTTLEMKDIETFTNTETDGLDEAWNFASIWSIESVVNDGYPCLVWQDNSCVATDDDNDGVSTETENAGPNGGDANNDGTLDGEQANVASMVDPTTGKYAVLEVDEQCSIESLTIVSETEVSNDEDSGFNYPAGLMDFRLDCGEDGFTATINQYYYGVSGEFIVRKFKPGTGYFTIEGATTTDQTIGGQQVKLATYQVTDGSNLDLDGTVDGMIEDPAGLASSADADTASDLSDTGRTIMIITLISATIVGISLVSIKMRSRRLNFHP